MELLEPGDISDESLSKWPPTGEKKNSLRKGMYTSFNKDIFQVSSVLLTSMSMYNYIDILNT